MSEETTGAARLAELEADNRRLRQLLDKANAPGELRHQLRNAVAIMRAIIRKSAETNRDLDAYVAHLEDRLDALARSQAAVDAHGSVEVHSLVADELFHYGASEGERVMLYGPDVDLQPRAGQMFALAIHELAVNSVEHGTLGTSTGRIEIAWSVSTEVSPASITFTWKELDMTGIAKPSHRGFGTEVLTQTLRYELEAETILAFEPNGLRCTIQFPLPERIGRVVYD